jgi:hypothetical protein
MLVHDVSDVPLDLVRVFMLLKWDVPTVSLLSITPQCTERVITILFVTSVLLLQYVSYAATLLAWAYLRLWVLGAVILRSVILHPTTSFVFPCEGGRRNPRCVTGFYAEMGVYVLLIGALWVLHVVWYGKMLQKGYRLLTAR